MQTSRAGAVVMHYNVRCCVAASALSIVGYRVPLFRTDVVEERKPPISILNGDYQQG